MKNMKRCMRRIFRLEAAILLIAAMIFSPALSEELIADLEAVPAVNTDADLLVGFVADSGANVNPFYCNNRDLISLNQLVFESVVELDDDCRPVPLLADKWVHKGKKWTFTLRSGIRFHNGEPLTAFDVLGSYQKIIEIGSACPYYARLSLIKSMEAPDEATLEITAAYSGYITLYAMTFPVVQTGTVNDLMPRGTGPYWYTQFIIDGGVRLERNPLWWKNDPAIESIAAVRYADSGDALEALHTHEIEVLCSQSSNAALSRRLSEFTSMDYITNTYELLMPNIRSSSVMGDLRMRQAVMYAIDSATLVSNAYLGMGIQCEVPVNPSSWLYESQSAVFYYSPERALQLIQACGWKDLTGDGMMNRLDGVMLQDLTLDLITYNETTTNIRENAANMIAAYLETVGIKVKVEVLGAGTVRDRIENRDYDLALIGMNLSEVPNLVPLLYSDGSLNLNRSGNDDMDALVEQSGSVSDEAEFKGVFSQIQLSLVERLPIMGLLFRTGTVLSVRSLAGLGGIRAGNMLNGLEFMPK